MSEEASGGTGIVEQNVPHDVGGTVCHCCTPGPPAGQVPRFAIQLVVAATIGAVALMLARKASVAPHRALAPSRQHRTSFFGTPPENVGFAILITAMLMRGTGLARFLHLVPLVRGQ